MNPLPKIIQKLDQFQQTHKLPGFLYAVIKKYGEDEAGYQAALLTYYGFLSLFPLLLVLTTLVGLIAGSHPALQDTVIKGTTNYFPMLGTQLSQHVHGLHKSGLALVIGVILTFYGARGVADAFRHGVNHIWQVPRIQRNGFPKSIIKSLGIVVIGGTGFLSASIIATYAAAVGHGHSPIFRILSLLINAFILFWIFTILLNLSLPRHVTVKETRSGAASAAIGLVLLQTVGGYILAHELKNLDALYSSFAVVLGLFFWIYLQAQVFYYSVEIASVHADKLWPRGFDAKRMTAADKRVYTRQAVREQLIPNEQISTKFESSNE